MAALDVPTVKVELCAYCGLEPFEGDEYPEPFTGWACLVCGAQICGFDEDGEDTDD